MPFLYHEIVFWTFTQPPERRCGRTKYYEKAFLLAALPPLNNRLLYRFTTHLPL